MSKSSSRRPLLIARLIASIKIRALSSSKRSSFQVLDSTEIRSSICHAKKKKKRIGKNGGRDPVRARRNGKCSGNDTWEEEEATLQDTLHRLFIFASAFGITHGHAGCIINGSISVNGSITTAGAEGRGLQRRHWLIISALRAAIPVTDAFNYVRDNRSPGSRMRERRRI